MTTKKAEPKVLYHKTVDAVAGVLVDLVERESKSGSTYLELVFETGETIQMPAGFHLQFDLVQNEQYAATWIDGKFYIVPGSTMDAVQSEVESTEDAPF